MLTVAGLWAAIAFRADSRRQDLPIALGKKVSIYTDHQLSPFEDIYQSWQAGEGFEPLDVEAKGFSRLNTISCWLHLPLVNDNESARDFILEVDYRWVDSAQLYSVDSSGSFEVFKSGEEVPISEKMVQTSRQAFRLRLEAGEERDYFLYLRDYNWLNPSLSIWPDPDTFIEQSRNEERLIHIYIGILSGLLLMNLCVYVVFRYKDVCYYIYYLLSVGLLQAINYNLHLPFVSFWVPGNDYFPGTGMNYFLLSGALSLSAGMLLLFTREFLQVYALSKHLDHLVRWSSGLFIVLSPVIMFGPGILLGKLITPIVVTIWAAGHGLALAVGIYSAYRKQAQARYFVPALLLLFIVSWRFNLALILGQVPTSEILSQWLVASCLEMTVFAFGLCERFLSLEEEKIEAKEIALIEAENHATLQKQYNQQLHLEVARQTHELTDSNAQKDELLRIIAHDLKSPIDGVSKLSRMLAETQNLSHSQIEANAREIERSATYLSGLTKNLLDWAHCRSEQNELSMQPYLVSDLIEGTEQVFDALNRENRLKLEWDVVEHVFAIFDFNAISTVLRNLISNAVKYSSEDHHSIRIIAQPNGERLKLSVCDQGTGITAERLAQLRQRESVEPEPGPRGESGTGIGLQICHSILSKHASELTFTSRADGGTMVSFELTIWTQSESHTIV